MVRFAVSDRIWVGCGGLGLRGKAGDWAGGWVLWQDWGRALCSPHTGICAQRGHVFGCVVLLCLDCSK